MGPYDRGTEEKERNRTTASSKRVQKGSEQRRTAGQVDAPQLRVAQVGQQPADTSGTWTITWSIVNGGDAPVALREIDVPHGKFCGRSVDLSSMDPLAPGERGEIQLSVVFKEAPGARVENAFLILTVVWREKVWRVFVRMTVRSDSAGAPSTQTELITEQAVGFSKEKR